MSKACIFCGTKGNKSKEHLWPEWMHEFLGAEGNGNNVRESDTYRDTAHKDNKKLERQGYLFTTKFRVVCRACNNGWMSRLEEEAKPSLIPLVKGKAICLNEVEQNIVAKWIAMKTIVGEHAEKGLHVTPEEDRRKFKEQGTIPDYYSIYLSIHGERDMTGWLRMSNTLSVSLDGPDPPLNGLQRNTQSVSFICGKMFVYVFAARANGIDSSRFVDATPLTRVAPLETPEVSIPNGAPINRDRINQIAWSLHSLPKHPRYIFAGDLPSEQA